MLLGYGISSLLGHHPLILHVALISKNHPLHILIGVLVNVPQPLGNVIKGLGIGDVVDEHDTHGATVVAGGDGVEPLLPSRVPDLKLYLLPPQLDGFDFEVNSNCGDKCCVKCVLGESE